MVPPIDHGFRRFHYELAQLSDTIFNMNGWNMNAEPETILARNISPKAPHASARHLNTCLDLPNLGTIMGTRCHQFSFIHHDLVEAHVHGLFIHTVRNVFDDTTSAFYPDSAYLMDDMMEYDAANSLMDVLGMTPDCDLAAWQGVCDVY